jgi:hypothetical protein
MPDVTTSDLIEYLNVLEKDRKVPYEMSQMMGAVENSVKNSEFELLGELLDTYISTNIRIYPDRPAEQMKMVACLNFATLCYLADHRPSPTEWVSLGPVEAFSHPQHYGRAMAVAKEIFDKRNINLTDVLQHYFLEMHL